MSFNIRSNSVYYPGHRDLRIRMQIPVQILQMFVQNQCLAKEV